jgi:hypothetical protein
VGITSELKMIEQQGLFEAVCLAIGNALGGSKGGSKPVARETTLPAPKTAEELQASLDRLFG